MIFMALPVNQVMPSRKNSSRDSIGDIALVANCLACTCLQEVAQEKQVTEDLKSEFNV